MRAIGLLGLLCVACTRPNPGFDEGANTTGEDVGGTVTVGPDTIDPATVGPATAGSGLDATGSTNGGTDPDTVGPITAAEDLPPEAICEQQPSPGLSIQLGDPMRLGGVCPPWVRLPVRLTSVEGNEAVLESCNDGCESCFGDANPLSVDLIALGDVLPPPGACLVVEAEALVLTTEDRCHWGALTLHEPMSNAAYLIATARSVPPTPAAAELLAGAIPQPTPGPSCTCAAIGQDDECCNAGAPPTFWYYTIDGEDVHPGDEAPIGLSGELEHSFRLFQAEHVPTCMNEELQLSWAVVAAP